MKEEGLFRRLLNDIRAIENEYNSFTPTLRSKLHNWGFTRASMNALTKVADQALEPIVNGVTKEAISKPRLDDPRQMTIFDFLPPSGEA